MLAYLEKGYEVHSPMMVYMLILRRFTRQNVANDPRWSTAWASRDRPELGDGHHA